jgi:hypothetical protein
VAGYPTRSQFFALGLPRKAFPAQLQLATAADPTGDVLTVPGHGLTTGDGFRMATDAGGGIIPAGVLPAGLSDAVSYFAKVTGEDLLQLSLTSGGSAVDFTTAGANAFGLIVDVGAKIDMMLDAVSRRADQCLKGYRTPLTGSVPMQLIEWVCKIGAYEMCVGTALVDPAFSRDPEIKEAAMRAWSELGLLQKDGTELAGYTGDDQTPGVLDNAAVGWSDAPRCWTPEGFL